MTCREVYDAALALLAEEVEDSENCEDYEARAPYILAMLFADCGEDNQFYRTAHGGKEETYFPAACVDLEDDFPLEDKFFPAAVFYLASLLVETEDTELSDRFFAKYADVMAKIRENIPASIEDIRDIYD